jgi:hypothetical protein
MIRNKNWLRLTDLRGAIQCHAKKRDAPAEIQ